MIYQMIAGEIGFPARDELKKIIKALKGELEFGLARRLLVRAREIGPVDDWIVQQLALCTYKDEELLPARRLAEALELLEQIRLRDPSNADAETLALGGAVYKRLWEHEGQLEYLYEALSFYRAAAERNPQQDLGYGGINAAYVLDLLTSRAERIAQRSRTPAVEADPLRQQAIALRERMLAELPKAAEQDPGLGEQYWYVVTLAEIHFGLQNYDEAGQWLARAANLDAREWEKQTTFKQLVSLARLQGVEAPAEGSSRSTWHPAWQALSALLGEDTERALSCFRGKVGLALSGGGFRASFFHLGVMARLAEMDALRGVEALSTVSGGSILGAHYYLEVQKLLESKPDPTITRQDYIDIVRRVQERFLEGVQKNIRMRAFDDLTDNLRMLFTNTYSRSHRLGELYESELYARIDDGRSSGPRTLPQLLVRPEGERAPETFKPKFSNWRRRARVPVFLLNTTSLNSGHNWHFTASWMGEPPGLLGEEIDVNERYRRVYYKEAPREGLKSYRLGYAVAASACVPGLFEPLVISELYPERTVQLVDGGVHDNQGVAGLLDEGCTLILCSDASGQMSDVKNPSDHPAGVLLRTSSILQDRVRETEYQDLRARLDSRALEGLLFVHTKKELASAPLDWINCQDPTPQLSTKGNRTSYGVDRDLQAKIAGIRTDLDSFTEVEAYALMASGYLISRREFELLQEQHAKDGKPGTWGGYDIHAPGGEWRFRALEPILALPAQADPRRIDLELQLEVASSGFFKAWRLVPELKRAASLIGATAALALSLLLWVLWDQTLFSFTGGALVMAILLFAAGLLVPALKWLFPQKEARSFAIKAAIALAGYLLAKVHLRFIDRRFLDRGKLDRLLSLTK
ncbi:MAG: tetratricopeptide repeat-containing protein [Gammaproteobacteria bacterium]